MEANAGKPLLRISHLSRRFGSFTAVEDVSLDVAQGEFFALLGPSGCGKTTLLRMLAGFETPDQGDIDLDGRSIIATPPHRRPVNMMFQSYALFPHLSVHGNIAFGLKREGLARDEISRRVEAMLRMVRLEGLADRRPSQLSGGQRQRVALARALAKQPKMLLLDEPMAALDKKLREETQFELMEIQRNLGLTFVVVTHDQKEAMVLANRVGIMNRGRLEQIGSPREVYERPATRFVAEFVGDINILECVVASVAGSGLILDCSDAGMKFRISQPAVPAASAPNPQPFHESQKVFLAVRPERMVLSPAGATLQGENANRLSGTVVEWAFTGEAVQYRIRLASGLVMRASRPNAGASETMFSRGDAVSLSFAPDAGVLLKE